MNTSRKSMRFDINFATGIVLAVAVYAYVFVKIRGMHFDVLKNQFTFRLIPVLLFIFCWLAQTATEIVKWQTLLSNKKHTSFAESAKSIFGGYAFSVITPARIGDWFGRALGVRKNKKEALVLASASSFLQTAVILFAAVPVLYIKRSFVAHIVFETGTKAAVISIGMLLIALLLAFVLKINFRKIDTFLQKAFNSIRNLKRETVVKTLLLTVFRYMLFSLQFAVLLGIFSQLHLREFIILIPLYYALITLLPVIGILEPGIRLTASYLIFEPTGIFPESLTAAVTLIWIFNLLIPALIGGAFVYRFSFLRSKK